MVTHTHFYNSWLCRRTYWMLVALTVHSDVFDVRCRYANMRTSMFFRTEAT